MWTRRELLAGGATLGAGLWLPSGVRAAVAPIDRKFVFVFARGGWDVSRVFAPVFSSAVARDPGDELVDYGGLRLVANPARPQTDRFFRRHHGEVALISGMLVRSVNHPICRNLVMTDTPTASRPDWPSTIGRAEADRFVVPHVVVVGYSMAGANAPFTALSGTEGQLQHLLGNAWAALADEPQVPLAPGLEALADAFVAQRGADRAAGSRDTPDGPLDEGLSTALGRLSAFKAQAAGLDLTGDIDLPSQIAQGVQYLSAGVARCVTLTTLSLWDTHANNQDQDDLYDDLFRDLERLDAALAAAPGTSAPTLAEETVVVVLSEMGRTPYLNPGAGKDHWMYTSAMLWGPGVVGGQVMGAYDDLLQGLAIEPATGRLGTTRGVALTPGMLGSTLLSLAGLDPAAELGQDLTLRPLLG